MIVNKKGFTLVEVIVVAVIVAILAVSSVQLYIGYVTDARKQVLEGIAGNAATYLNTALNLDATVTSALIPSPITSVEKWVTVMGSGDSATFSPPVGITVEIADDSVYAYSAEDTSAYVQFR